MANKHNHGMTRLEGAQLQPILLDLPEPQGHFSTSSVRHRRILSGPEDRYLIAWLFSRLDLPTLTPKEDSALLATKSDRRQLARLLGIARERGLLDHLDGSNKMIAGRAAAA